MIAVMRAVVAVAAVRRDEGTQHHEIMTGSERNFYFLGRLSVEARGNFVLRYVRKIGFFLGLC